jgi:hypothetical protein
MKPRQVLLHEYVPRRLKSRGLIECTDMEVRFRRGLALQVNVDPHLAQNPRHRRGDELNLVISPLVTT